ncbi:MAG: hypothetical protein ACP5KN_01435 [Armatimonadota bacterium]
MGIISWLRRIVADFFCVGEDDTTREAEQVRAELDELRTLVLLAVAQARRTELDLRQLLDAAEPDVRKLTLAMSRLEVERGRARELMDRFRMREEAAAERLARLGDLRMAEEINQRRAELRRSIGETGGALDKEELTRLEDEARAEAYRLDVLDHLEATGGHTPQPAPHTPPQDRENVISRARALLEEPNIEEPLSEG